MPTIASYVDILLYGLLAATVAIIIYKALDLWFPAILGKKPFAARDVSTEALVAEEIEQLEGFLTALAVLASTAPFVGLAGTVMHIMQALKGMGLSADMSLISGPIATALNATLVGLASAIPAAAAYSLMQRRLQVLTNRLLRRAGV